MIRKSKAFNGLTKIEFAGYKNEKGMLQRVTSPNENPQVLLTVNTASMVLTKEIVSNLLPFLREFEETGEIL